MKTSMFSWTASLQAAVGLRGLRRLRWGWSHQRCGKLIVTVPSPIKWTSDFADGGSIPQTHTLTLVLCVWATVVWHPFWFMYTKSLTLFDFCSGWPDVFFPANVLCQLQFRVLSADNSLAVLFLAVVAGGDPVPFPCYMLRVLKCWKVRHYTEEEEHTRTYWLLIHLTSDFWSLDGDISHR